MMEIRKIRLPQDIDELVEVTLASFQYPENPEWSIQQEEVEEVEDQMKAIKRFWPLLRLGMLISPRLRHLLKGYICEEDSRMIGTLMHQLRPGVERVYYISNVAVHPDARRRGIARKLVEAALEEMRAGGGSKVMLDVIAGNLPAYKLYEKLGWEHFSGNVHLLMDGEPEETAPIPQGYEIVEIPSSNWQTDFQFAQRVIPLDVQQYDPITEERFKEGALMRFLETLTGVKRNRLALRSLEDGQVIAMSGCRWRTRPGGSNNIRVIADPAYSQFVAMFVSHVTRRVQQHAPGRKLELVTPSWQPDVSNAAQELGFAWRYEYHSMGLFLE